MDFIVYELEEGSVSFEQASKEFDFAGEAYLKHYLNTLGYMVNDSIPNKVLLEDGYFVILCDYVHNMYIPHITKGGMVWLKEILKGV